MRFQPKISGLILFIISLLPANIIGQQLILRGFVSDSAGHPLNAVSITIKDTYIGTQSDNEGRFEITLNDSLANRNIVFSRIGLRTLSVPFKPAGRETSIRIVLYEDVNPLREVTVNSSRRENEGPYISLPVKDAGFIPSPSGNFESYLKIIPGVASNNELTSQYSVHGGSYDENLVYVNDIEIFRPFLIRSAQQEGLSFINPDMVASVKFSSGGFSSVYGDKLSSVLDIKYKTPVSAKGSVKAGLLNSSAHYEGISKNKRLTYIIGTRYKSSRLMLKTLDSKGDYEPVFADIQSLIRYATKSGSSFSLLSTYSSNTYNFIPQSRESIFGNETQAYRLYVLFEGREKDRYKTWNNNLTWSSSENRKIRNKVILSSLYSSEKESFDIKGLYSLSSLDNNYGSDNTTDSIMNIGIGSWLSHARNNLYALIISLSYKGEAEWNSSHISWGVKMRNDRINDKIKEWTKVDSAEFSVPTGKDLLVTNLISSENTVNNWLYDGYINARRSFFIGSGKTTLNAGIRAFYDSYTKELLASPRLFTSVELNSRITLHFSGGVYYQTPFYREMRYPDGKLNPTVKSQKAVHLVAGFNYYFKAWDRPFVLSTEIYNKNLSSIIPYRYDNVRITYSGVNSAEGYSRGIDFRVNGEFVPDAESWISLSIMNSELKIPSSTGYFPSPSDQTVNLNIFFQDYLPAYPTWKAHLTISYVTGIPVFSSFSDSYDKYHRIPDYRRVDLGITKVIIGPGSSLNNKKYFRLFNELIAGAEIFNLMDINNTISYLWIRTVSNLTGDSRQYAVPDYLTGRSLNLSLTATF
jgi:hypothetical protein